MELRQQWWEQGKRTLDLFCFTMILKPRGLKSNKKFIVSCLHFLRPVYLLGLLVLFRCCRILFFNHQSTSFS
jgi:hypothetical protein